jgi:hypothetical protein
MQGGEVIKNFSRKKNKKPLDKAQKMCYNKDKIKQMRVATYRKKGNENDQDDTEERYCLCTGKLRDSC